MSTMNQTGFDAVQGQRWFVVDEDGGTFVLPSMHDAWEFAVRECAGGVDGVRLGSVVVPFDMSAEHLADYVATHGANEWPNR